MQRKRNRRNLAEEKTTVVFLFVSSLFFANTDHEYGVFLCVPLDVRTILNTQFSSWHTQKSALELYRTKQPTELWLGMSEWKATMVSMGEQACIHTSTHRHIQKRTHTRASTSTNDIEILCGPWTKKKTNQNIYSRNFSGRENERVCESGSERAQSAHTLCYCCVSTEWMDGWHTERHGW